MCRAGGQQLVPGEQSLLGTQQHCHASAHPAQHDRGSLTSEQALHGIVFCFSLKRKLEEKVVNPVDFLKHLKDPVGRTRSAVRAADYLETTLKLLKIKLHLSGKWRFNVTGSVV